MGELPVMVGCSGGDPLHGSAIALSQSEVNTTTVERSVSCNLPRSTLSLDAQFGAIAR